jgi:integrin beta 3
MMFDGKAFGEQMVSIVKGYVDRVFASFKSDIDKDIAEFRAKLQALEASPPKDGRDGVDGKDVDPELTRALIEKTVAAAVAALPPPERGAKGEPGERGADGKDGVDGKDADADAILDQLIKAAVPSIIAEVEKAVAALPPPERGEKGDPGERGETGDPGQDGKDGTGLADALLDRDGQLVLTLSDGRVKTLGAVVGRDGAPGKDAPPPFTIDDLECSVLDDDRTVQFLFRSGELEHVVHLKWPVVIDRGVFTEKQTYEMGDGVTWAGHFWIAQRATNAKPGYPDSGWRLAVKKGRDGKDAGHGA